METSLRAAGSAAGGNFRGEARVWKAVGLLLGIRAWGQGSKFPFNLLGERRRGRGRRGLQEAWSPRSADCASTHDTPTRGVYTAALSPGCATARGVVQAELGQVTRWWCVLTEEYGTTPEAAHTERGRRVWVHIWTPPS